MKLRYIKLSRRPIARLFGGAMDQLENQMENRAIVCDF